MRAQRASQSRILERLRLAARRGDRTALALALDEMRTLAFTPRHWVRYLQLLRNPLARLVDLLVIKQGERIAQQKGWPEPTRRRRPTRAGQSRPTPSRSRKRPSAPGQPTLFPDL